MVGGLTICGGGSTCSKILEKNQTRRASEREVQNQQNSEAILKGKLLKTNQPIEQKDLVQTVMFLYGCSLKPADSD